MNTIFGRCRIRKSLKLNLVLMLKEMLHNNAKLNYAYYFYKNCPQIPQWAEKKKMFIAKFESKFRLALNRQEEGGGV